MELLVERDALALTRFEHANNGRNTVGQHVFLSREPDYSAITKVRVTAQPLDLALNNNQSVLNWLYSTFPTRETDPHGTRMQVQ